MASDHGECGGDIAMRDRDACCSGNTNCRGDAGNNSERNACFHQSLCFFASATEHEWVAALEAHHIEVLTTEMHQQ